MNHVPFVYRCVSVALVVSLSACCSTAPETPPPSYGQFVSVFGDRIFVRQRGSGPDVFLLHGLGDCGVGWQFIEPKLVEAGCRVTTWDAFGAGRSDKPKDGDYRLEAHARRFWELADRLAVERPVLIGHSLGGTIALGLAQQRPQRVRGLVLIDPPAYRDGALDGHWFWEVPLLAETVLGIMSTCSIVRVGLEQNFHDKNAVSEDLEITYLRELQRDGAIEAFIAQERQLVPTDAERWERGHGTITAPTLIIWGEEDRLVPLSQGERLVEQMPDVRLITFPDAGHSPHLEVPEIVLECRLPFLRSITVDSSFSSHDLVPHT